MYPKYEVTGSVGKKVYGAEWLTTNPASKAYYERIGMLYRQQRQIRHLSQEQVAEQTGCRSKNTVSLFEQGRSAISIYQLKLLCEAIGVSYIKLLDRVERGEDML